MKPIFTSKQAAPVSVKPTVYKVLGENKDLQFTSTGDALVDLIAQGPDTFLQKTKAADIKRYIGLVNNAVNQDREMTLKIARYFKDQEQGQGLKEQSVLLIAALHDNISCSEVLSILTVNPNGDSAISIEDLDLLDSVKILAWHHYLFGAKAKLGYGVCKAFAVMFRSSKECLGQVLRHKGKNIQYDSTNKKQVSIIDVLGIIRNFKGLELPALVAQEYDMYLKPRYRRKQYGTRPTSALGIQHYMFHTKKLPSGEVPEGISFDKVMASGNDAAIRTMLTSGRLSNTQLKINLATALRLCTAAEISAIFSKRNMRMFPHEILGMARAFHQGTQFTKKNDAGVALANEILKSTVQRYKAKATKNVVFLGDTSGSMGGKLSDKSSLSQADFSAFISFFGAHVSGHRVFGIWDSDARLYRASANVDVKEYISANIGSNASTNVIKAIETLADWLVANKVDNPPSVICLISDMQFDAACGLGGYRISAMQAPKSISVEAALKRYQQKVGVVPQLAFWNVAANTTPAVEQDGVLMLGGFSANTCDILFGIMDNAGTQERKIKPQDIVQFIRETYV